MRAQEPMAQKASMSITNIVLGWLGYDLCTENDCDEHSQGNEVKDDGSSWIWVEQDGDKLSQNDLEFFERKQQKQPPLLSYADAVKASFERCKQGKNGAMKRTEDVDDIETEAESKLNWNLAKAKMIKQEANTCVYEGLPMKMKADRKRKASGRYQPFPKNPKISYLEKENITNYVLDRQLVPYNSGRITLQNFTGCQANLPVAKTSYDSHWITVGKKNCSFKPVCYPKVSKMRFVVDVSDNNCINVLRMHGHGLGLKSSRSRSLKDLYTVVDDVKRPFAEKVQRECARSLSKVTCSRKTNNSKREIKDIEKRINPRKSAYSKQTSNDNCKTRCTEFAITENMLPLQYLLAIQSQPMAIEWPQKEKRAESSQRVFDSFKFMEDVFTGIINLALSLSQIEVGNLEDFSIERCGSSQKDQEVTRKTERPSKRSVTQKALRGKSDKKMELVKSSEFGIHKRNVKKRCAFKNLYKATKQQGKRNSKNRNFTPQKFSGRGGARGW